MISIIIPTLQEEKLIETMLKALKSGLTVPHEIIVSDGGSRDQTAALARKYADKVIVYTGVKRQTIAQGRNDGAKAAAGDILMFLDADCFLNNPNEFLQKINQKFSADKDLVALTGWLLIQPEERTFFDQIIPPIVSASYWFLNNVLHHGGASGEFQAIRRTAFEQLGGYREEMTAGEDIDMFSRLSRIGKTRLARDLVIYHTGRRVHKIGWPHLLTLWFLNTVWLIVWRKAYSEEWVPIR
jgi:glycosyltransferase involved in cell wall biosynthesis